VRVLGDDADEVAEVAVVVDGGLRERKVGEDDG
jgi:hypothetical protein